MWLHPQCNHRKQNIRPANMCQYDFLHCSSKTDYYKVTKIDLIKQEQLDNKGISIQYKKEKEL